MGSEKVNLAKPADWNAWIPFLRTRATRNKIWELVNPDLSVKPMLLKAPKTPELTIPDDDSLCDIDAYNPFKAQKKVHKVGMAEYERQREALADRKRSLLLRGGKPNGESGRRGGPNSKDERVAHAIGKEEPKSDSLHGFPDSDPIIQVTEIEFCEDKPDTATSNAEAIVAPFTKATDAYTTKIPLSPSSDSNLITTITEDTFTPTTEASVMPTSDDKNIPTITNFISTHSRLYRDITLGRSTYFGVIRCGVTSFGIITLRADFYHL
ncbi:hypothetical protein MMC22_007636 [Lobaria immixta]|nr:hypothetical protein [Lobaria immixta]